MKRVFAKLAALACAGALLFAGQVPVSADTPGAADAYLFPVVDYLGNDYTSIYQSGDQIRITLSGNAGGTSTILTTSADAGEGDALAIPSGSWTVTRLDYLRGGQAQGIMTACPRSVSVDSDSGMDFKIAVGAGAVWNDYQDTSNVFEGGGTAILSQAATADSESSAESAASAAGTDSTDASTPDYAEQEDPGTVIHGSSLLDSESSAADSPAVTMSPDSQDTDHSLWSEKNRLPLTIVLVAMLGACGIALLVIRYRYKHRALDDSEADDDEDDIDDEGV